MTIILLLRVGVEESVRSVQKQKSVDIIVWAPWVYPQAGMILEI